MKVIQRGSIKVNSETGEIEISGFVFDCEGGPIDLSELIKYYLKEA